jgi:hypothetical protein
VQAERRAPCARPHDTRTSPAMRRWQVGSATRFGRWQWVCASRRPSTAVACAGQRPEAQRLVKLHASHRCFLLPAIALHGSPSRLAPITLVVRFTIGRSPSSVDALSKAEGYSDVCSCGAAPACAIAQRAGSLPRRRNRPTLTLLHASRPVIYLDNGRAAEAYRCRRSGGLPARALTIQCKPVLSASTSPEFPECA